MEPTTTSLADKRRFVNLQISEEMVAELDRLAAEGERTRSAQVRLAIKEHLERKKEQAA